MPGGEDGARAGTHVNGQHRRAVALLSIINVQTCPIEPESLSRDAYVTRVVPVGRDHAPDDDQEIDPAPC
jgi:hypothetical protein